MKNKVKGYEMETKLHFWRNLLFDLEVMVDTMTELESCRKVGAYVTESSVTSTMISPHILHSVPNSSFCDNVFGFRVVVFYFFSKLSDKHPEILRVFRVCWSPYFL